MTMKSVLLYTKSYCPYCQRAIELIRSKGVEYTVIDVMKDRPNNFEEIKQQTGMTTVPQIFIGDEFVGGCDNIYALERAGKLNEKLEI